MELWGKKGYTSLQVWLKYNNVAIDSFRLISRGKWYSSIYNITHIAQFNVILYYCQAMTFGCETIYTKRLYTLPRLHSRVIYYRGIDRLVAVSRDFVYFFLLLDHDPGSKWKKNRFQSSTRVELISALLTPPPPPYFIIHRCRPCAVGNTPAKRSA